MSSPELSAALQKAFLPWQQGQQDEALEALRPFADAGEPPAVALIAWLYGQRGQPFAQQAVPYARQAVKAGMPWAANTVLAHLWQDPQFRTQAVELFGLQLAAGWPVDPISQAWNLMAQSDWMAAQQVLEMSSRWPEPDGFAAFVESAQAQASVLRSAAADATTKRDEFIEQLRAYDEDLTSERDRVKSQANQVLGLIDQALTGEVQSHFEQEARQYKGESQVLWLVGVGVLALAAILALLPLVLHYAGYGDLSGTRLFTAHLTPAVALGAVAGVLLTRARNRDRARQRARDLSIVLVTVFAYSGQIADVNERQRFLHDMGRLVFESFLQAHPDEEHRDSRSVLESLISR